MSVPTHTFDSTTEAYDASQCDDDIKDGDVLLVPSEQVAGVLVAAWPVSVTEQRGCFHTLDVTQRWDTFEEGRYLDSVHTAQIELERLYRACGRDLNSELLQFTILPDRPGNLPGAIVMWFRERDASFGTHLAFLERGHRVALTWGHYDFYSYESALADARERVDLETRRSDGNVERQERN